VHDAISAERLGIPAVAVITRQFLPTGHVMADFLGLHNYPVACIAHPISDNTELEISAKAEMVVQQSLVLLERQHRANE
jgi:hypothetical protein